MDQALNYIKPPYLQAELKIFGLVQGVFFRDFMQSSADKNRIKGWVKNSPDGTVEALIQGAPADLTKFTDECKIGPEGAHVEKIDIKISEIGEPTFSDFQIRL